MRAGGFERIVLELFNFQVKHLKSNEAEVAQLRGLTNEQRESINSLSGQIDDYKCRLEDANGKLDDALERIRKLTFQYQQ